MNTVDPIKSKTLKWITFFGILILITAVGWWYHLKITKPIRITQSFLNHLRHGQYDMAVKMCNDKNSQPILGENGNIKGIHFDNNIASFKNDWYFDELKNRQICHPPGLYWYIKINFIGDARIKGGFIQLGNGCYFVITGGTIEYIKQKL